MYQLFPQFSCACCVCISLWVQSYFQVSLQAVRDKVHSTEESVSVYVRQVVEKLKVRMVTLQMAASYMRMYMADSSTVIQLTKYYDMICAWTTSVRLTCRQRETRCKLWKRLHYRKRKNWTSARYVCSYPVCTCAEVPLM